MALKKWQRNSIFEAMAAAGVNLFEFELDETGPEVRFGHLGSTSYLLLGGDVHEWVVSDVVGDSEPQVNKVYTWPILLSRIGQWAADAKQDAETPDLWAELRRNVALLGAGPEPISENTPFTPDERELIAGELRNLSDSARLTGFLSDPQMLVLEEKIDYLFEASGRLGRLDWKNAWLGTLLGYFLSTTVPSDAGRDLLVSFLQNTAHFYAQGFQALPHG